MPILPILAVGALALAARASHGSRALFDEGNINGRWGSQGVGVLLTTGRQILLMLRSPYVMDPNCWGIPGGAVPIDDQTGQPDDLASTAVRELREETGLQIDHGWLSDNLVGTTIFRDQAFRFTTFIAWVPAKMTRQAITLNWESEDHMWAKKSDLQRLDVHPGVAFTLQEAQGIIFSPTRARSKVKP